jgi:hypothetical protein
MHPLVQNLSSLKDSEIEFKVNDLTRKYFMTSNYEVRSQISVILETYKEELSVRRQKELDRMANERNKDLDKLININ